MATDEKNFDRFVFKKGEFIVGEITISKTTIKTKKQKGKFISGLTFTTSLGNKFNSGLTSSNTTKTHLQSKDTFLAGF